MQGETVRGDAGGDGERRCRGCDSERSYSGGCERRCRGRREVTSCRHTTRPPFGYKFQFKFAYDANGRAEDLRGRRGTSWERLGCPRSAGGAQGSRGRSSPQPTRQTDCRGTCTPAARDMEARAITSLRFPFGTDSACLTKTLKSYGHKSYFL